MTHNLHNNVAIEVFSRIEDAKTLFRAFVSEEHLRALDLDSLSFEHGSFVDEKVRDRHSDILFSVRAHDVPVLIYLLFEHKSYQDRWLVLQLLIYIGRIWEKYRSEHGDDCRLPMILPVVLYHGEAPWNRPLRPVDLCATGGNLIDVLGPAQPTVPLTLIDLSRIPENELERTLSRGTALALLTVLLMKSIRGTEILRRLRSWRPIVRRTRMEAGGLRMLELLVNYILQAAREEVDIDNLGVVLSDAIGPETEELVMNTGEKLMRKGEERALRRTLLSHLEERFGEIPEVVHSRLDAADLETLDRWVKRTISAVSLEDVFRP